MKDLDHFSTTICSVWSPNPSKNCISLSLEGMTLLMCFHLFLIKQHNWLFRFRKWERNIQIWTSYFTAHRKMPVVKVPFHSSLKIWSLGTRWRQLKFVRFQCCGLGRTLGVGSWFAEVSKVQKVGHQFDYNRSVSPINSHTYTCTILAPKENFQREEKERVFCNRAVHLLE